MYEHMHAMCTCVGVHVHMYVLCMCICMCECACVLVWMSRAYVCEMCIGVDMLITSEVGMMYTCMEVMCRSVCKSEGDRAVCVIKVRMVL